MARRNRRQALRGRQMSGGTLSRRGFLALIAAGTVAACAPSRGVASAKPTVILPVPSGAITQQSSAHLRKLAALDLQDGKIRGVAWSPASRIVAAGGQGDIHLWDTATAKSIGTRHGHRGQIHGMAWSSTAGLLASASVDGTIRLWSFSSGETVKVLNGEGSATFACVAW